MRVIDRRWWARGDSGESETVEESRNRKPTVVEELEQRLAGAQEQLQAVLLEHRRAADEFEQVKVHLEAWCTRRVSEDHDFLDGFNQSHTRWRGN